MSLNSNNGHNTGALEPLVSSPNKIQSIRRVRKAGSALILVRGLPHMTSTQKGRGVKKYLKFADKPCINFADRGGGGQKIKKCCGCHVDVIYESP